MVSSLVAAVKNGDKVAFEQLLESYEPLIGAECTGVLSKFPDFSDEEEEMRQEGRLALYNAAMAYEDGQVTFGLYAKICIHNRLISYLRKLRTARRRQARVLLRQTTSVGKTTEAELLLSEDTNGFKRIFDEVTSPYEKKVFLMYLDKMSYAQIAGALGKSVKSVDNAIARVKAKLRKRLSETKKI